MILGLGVEKKYSCSHPKEKKWCIYIYKRGIEFLVHETRMVDRRLLR